MSRYGSSHMSDLRGTKTEDNLRTAFARECESNLRYLYFAQRADIEGHPQIAALFRTIADGETGHAFGHLDFLTEIEDPATGTALDSTEDDLASAMAGETHDASEMYPSFADIARDEGFTEIADWMDTLARAEQSQADRFAEALRSLR